MASTPVSESDFEPAAACRHTPHTASDGFAQTDFPAVSSCSCDRDETARLRSARDDATQGFELLKVGFGYAVVVFVGESGGFVTR